MKLSPNQQKIIGYLSGGDWKCMANADFYMKDDRKRISELVQKGFIIDGEPCRAIDSGCNRKHDSGVFMRRLRQYPTKLISKVIEKNGKYYETKIEVPAYHA